MKKTLSLRLIPLLLTVLLTALLATLLTGCGQTGPLYLPTDNAAQHSNHSNSNSQNKPSDQQS